jgi:hypothetical protein
MVLKERIALMTRLGNYLGENTESWQQAKNRASQQNPWFTEEYIDTAINNIRDGFLKEEALQNWLKDFPAPGNTAKAPQLGLVMAGNIPLVGFHDFLAAFLAGLRLKIKLSSKDKALWETIFQLLYQWEPQCLNQIETAEQLKGCDAYIATGSNNSARYFEFYFQKYPHIIRRNRTSAAILSGQESPLELEKLSDVIGLYFGMGCRNVTKIFVPENYNFEPLIHALNKYGSHIDHNKYKNNYDFQLAIYLLNRIPYMSSNSILLIPSDNLFAPVSVLHYETYSDANPLLETLSENDSLQCLIGAQQYFRQDARLTPFGTAQKPGLTQYADQVDTLAFLKEVLKNPKTTIH